MLSVKEAQKWSRVCLYSPYVPILWIRRWTNPCPRCHTVLWGLFFCPTISCLLLITRFSRTWVGLWQCFRLRHQRHPHLMWKSHWWMCSGSGAINLSCFTTMCTFVIYGNIFGLKGHSTNPFLWKQLYNVSCGSAAHTALLTKSLAVC